MATLSCAIVKPGNAAFKITLAPAIDRPLRLARRSPDRRDAVSLRPHSHVPEPSGIPSSTAPALPSMFDGLSLAASRCRQ